MVEICQITPHGGYLSNCTPIVETCQIAPSLVEICQIAPLWWRFVKLHRSGGDLLNCTPGGDLSNCTSLVDASTRCQIALTPVETSIRCLITLTPVEASTRCQIASLCCQIAPTPFLIGTSQLISVT